MIRPTPPQARSQWYPSYAIVSAPVTATRRSANHLAAATPDPGAPSLVPTNRAG
jgi:hypothetical protein